MIYTLADGRTFDLRFRCPTCNKLTAGRRPREGRNRGDGTFYYPRWHASPLGDPCPGVFAEAEWVEREISSSRTSA